MMCEGLIIWGYKVGRNGSNGIEIEPQLFFSAKIYMGTQVSSNPIVYHNET